MPSCAPWRFALNNMRSFLAQFLEPNADSKITLK